MHRVAQRPGQVGVLDMTEQHTPMKRSTRLGFSILAAVLAVTLIGAISKTIRNDIGGASATTAPPPTTLSPHDQVMMTLSRDIDECVVNIATVLDSGDPWAPYAAWGSDSGVPTKVNMIHSQFLADRYRLGERQALANAVDSFTDLCFDDLDLRGVVLGRSPIINVPPTPDDPQPGAAQSVSEPSVSDEQDLDVAQLEVGQNADNQLFVAGVVLTALASGDTAEVERWYESDRRSVPDLRPFRFNPAIITCEPHRCTVTGSDAATGGEISVQLDMEYADRGWYVTGILGG